MKKLILAIFLLITTLSYSQREINGVLYREYVDKNFGFSVEYPLEILFMHSPTEIGSGRKFLSEDQTIEMSVYGSNTFYFDDDSTDDGLDDKKKVRDNYYDQLDYHYQNAKITYKKLDEDKGWYVISGTMNNEIFYRKARLISDSAPYFLVFEMRYPINKKGTFNKILEDISKSIKY